jgi:predicted transcriptional regulator of viral defense system
MSKSRFEMMELIKKQIINEFDEKFNRGDIVLFKDINNMLKYNKLFSVLPKVTRVKDLINFLVENNVLISFEHQISKKSSTTKYAFREIQKYKTPLKLRNKSFLSHYTAMYLHNLTENIPKNVYTNKEQSKKPSNKNRSLQQSSIDRAFSKPMRKTNHIVSFSDFNAYMLNGKNTERLGITEIEVDGEELPITDIERTLLDVSIRPGYGGGVEEILSAYENAKGEISINRLLSYLRKMDYIYPYHQGIGFYLERAGYKESQLKLLESMDIEYNFYLNYNMKNPSFSERWKLYYPGHL